MGHSGLPSRTPTSIPTRSKKTCHRAFRPSLSTWPRYKRFRRYSVCHMGQTLAGGQAMLNLAKYAAVASLAVGLALAATKPASAVRRRVILPARPN
jgi:hypothetical protein